MKNESTDAIAKTLEANVTAERSYNYRSMSVAACRTKRVFDFLGSLLGMVVFSPVYLTIYCLIKREDGGPAIFKQERIGYGGKPFTLYKFRSMKTGRWRPGHIQAGAYRLRGKAVHALQIPLHDRTV